VAIGRDGAVRRQLRTLFNVGAVRELTDGQLLERFATDRGEAAELAFAVLVERHGPMVMRVCRGVLADPHDAQDAFQATFLVLVKRARRLWVRDSLGPWLHQVAYRTASCARSTAARHRRLELHAARPEQESRPERDLELERLLHEEIDRLPDRYRSPVVLCDLEGCTYEQAARHLGWPVGTVKSRLARGRERLRDRLIRRGLVEKAGLFTVAGLFKTPGLPIPPALLDATTAAAVRFAAMGSAVRGSAVLLAEGVIRTMSMTQWWKVATVLLAAGATASGVGWLGYASGQGAQAPVAPQDKSASASSAPTREVKPGKLEFVVSERGSVEAGRAEELYCNSMGNTTIIKIVPEGLKVKKGQIIAELDSAGLRNLLVNQRITTKSAEANYLNARLAREVAEIALKEYVDGIYPQDLQTVANAIAGSEATIRKIESRLSRTREASHRLKEALASKAKAQADIVAEVDLQDRIEEAELSLDRERRALEQAQGRRDVLMNFTRAKATKELEGEIQKARSQELVKESTWELEKSKEKNLENQIANSTLKAPIDGIVVYADDPARIRAGVQNAIEEGATVLPRQKIASVFDVNGPMQINLKVREAVIDKLVPKMKARVKVDAFPDLELTGVVTEIAGRPDPPNAFNRDIKVYTTRVRLDRGQPGLRPGMTAQGEVVIGERDYAIAVPVEAVVSYERKKWYVGVNTPDGRVEWREVVLGAGDTSKVEVKEGLRSGDRVILDPVPLLSDEQRANLIWPDERELKKAAASRKGRGSTTPSR
jgi:RND family efflux transporter MFP subunit